MVAYQRRSLEMHKASELSISESTGHKGCLEYDRLIEGWKKLFVALGFQGLWTYWIQSICKFI